MLFHGADGDGSGSLPTIDQLGDYCDRRFECGLRLRALKKHVRMEHPEHQSRSSDVKDLICDTCGAAFLRKGALDNHRQKMHGASIDIKLTNRFPCPHCGKSFVGKHTVRNHIRTIHEGAKDFMCGQCGKCFGQLGVLQTHILAVHTPDAQKFQHPCPHCAKLFTTKHSMKFHMQSLHLGMKKYLCSFCDKCFMYKYNLDVHIKSVHSIAVKAVSVANDKRKQSATAANNGQKSELELEQNLSPK